MQTRYQLRHSPLPVTPQTQARDVNVDSLPVPGACVVPTYGPAGQASRKPAQAGSEAR